MKTVRDACILQDNALDIRVSDQIEQLDELIATEEDGRAFFDKTHITQGMRTLLTEGLARLAGKSNQAIFHLKQAMGGGKTHLLVGFGLLSKHPTLRIAYCSEIPHINSFDTASVAAFNGRNSPHHYFWGEIAQQLGKAELFREYASIWANCPRSLPYVKGDVVPVNEQEAWELMRTPLPPASENTIFANLRMHLNLDDKTFFCDKSFTSLGWFEQELVRQTLDMDFFKNNNPILRHTVLRRRDVLEEMGLLEKIAVNIHPDPNRAVDTYHGQNFNGIGLMTNHPFDLAYKAAEDFTAALRKRNPSAGFMKSLLLQRICSSFASGKATATRMLQREVFDDEEDCEQLKKALDGLYPNEILFLERIVAELSRPEARDPKLSAVKYFLTEHMADGKTWLELGCIIFSQYYDTAFWVASELAKILPDEPIAVYAGLGKSGLFKGNEFNSVDRNDIKAAVKKREIRLVVATDAACEGLNLQTLGTLINIDLPWNPSRLEQRLGRIKRFGQARRSVDMLNLVYADTQDEKVYQTISRRLKDKFDIFGGLPDTIEDEWIDDIEELEEKVDKYIHMRQQAMNAFELRYQGGIDLDKNRWELCSKVLSRKDVTEKLSEAW